MHVVRITGEFDVGTAPLVDQAIARAVDGACSGVVLDLSGTTFLDSSALAALVHAARHLRDHRCDLVVVASDAPQPVVKFDLSGTRQFFRLCDSLDEAVQALTEPPQPDVPPAPVSVAPITAAPPEGNGHRQPRRVHLRLYVNGAAGLAPYAIDAVDELRGTRLPGAVVEVVDLQAHPEVAESERLLATPMLVRLAPAPVRRVVGDLADLDAVLHALDLHRGLHAV